MTDKQFKLNQLRQYQSMSLKSKIRLSEMRIRQAYDHFDGQMYIAISGKDSCAGANLVWNMFQKCPAVFVDTGNELESVKENIYELIKAGRPIEIIKPAGVFWDIVKKDGWPILSKQICMGINRFVNTKSFTQKRLRAFGGINPTSGKKQQRTVPKKFHYILRAVLRKELKVTTKCCGELKIKPFKKYEKRTGRHPFIFTMATDSMTRKESYLKNGCNAFGQGVGESRPLMFWLEQDILQYIRENHVRIAKAYGEKRGKVWYMQEQNEDGTYRMCGDDRTGCKFCLFGIHMEKGENRIQRLARVEPESYQEFIDHGGDKVMDFLGLDWKPKEEKGK